MQRSNANPQLLPNGFSYQRSSMSAQKSLSLFYYLQRTLNWQQPHTQVYGKTGPIPRLQSFFADNSVVRYGYSQMQLPIQAWDPILLALKQRLEQHLKRPFNSLLANYYRDGNDTMGFHSDDEIELGTQPCIACISLGAERAIKLKHKATNKVTHLPLHSGSLLLMHGHSQRDYQHAIAKQAKLQHPRISLTFRYILPDRI